MFNHERQPVSLLARMKQVKKDQRQRDFQEKPPIIHTPYREDKHRQARAKLYYEEYVIPQLSLDVREAEIARKKHDHQTTESLTGPWIEPKAVVREGKVHKRFLVLEKAQKRLGQNYLDEELSNAYFFFLTSVKLGLAGMGRIAHVDANTQIKNDPRRHLPHLATIQNVDDLFIAIDPKSLPPRTIHFDPISWIGERSQDSAKTMELMNQPNLAVQEIQAAI